MKAHTPFRRRRAPRAAAVVRAVINDHPGAAAVIDRQRTGVRYVAVHRRAHVEVVVVHVMVGDVHAELEVDQALCSMTSAAPIAALTTLESNGSSGWPNLQVETLEQV